MQPDDQKINKKIECKVKFSNLLVEHSSELLVALADLVLEFKCIHLHSDLFSNPYGKKALGKSSLIK